MSNTAKLISFRVGGSDDYATLHLKVDDLLDVTVGFSSREAREFAIAVLTQQGPYLIFQPPNESMREFPKGPARHGSSGEPWWKNNQKIEHAQRKLEEVIESNGEEALGYALRRLGF